jgi:ABC-2 type transport system permease protein
MASQAAISAAALASAARSRTYFLRILRTLLLKGAGLEAIWKDVLSLCAFAFVLVTLSATRFRKSLD